MTACALSTAGRSGFMGPVHGDTSPRSGLGLAALVLGRVALGAWPWRSGAASGRDPDPGSVDYCAQGPVRAAAMMTMVVAVGRLRIGGECRRLDCLEGYLAV
jgi:hypothetical protein